MLTDFGLRAYESNPLTSMFFPPFSLSRLICEGFFVVFFFPLFLILKYLRPEEK